MNRIYLNKKREDSIKRFHPWIFSGAIDSVDTDPKEGELMEICSFDEEVLAYGHFQVGSIALRILSFGKEFNPDTFWTERIQSALNLRKAQGVVCAETNCYRLIHGEGDMLPGLIIDWYDGVAVMQAHSAGMFLSKDAIVSALKACYGSELKAVYDKSEGTAPYKAGLKLGDDYIYTSEDFDKDIQEHQVEESGNKFIVNWVKGQKTGFFLDQRENRRLVGSYAKDRSVLNLFCYTGGFSISALRGGAKLVESVDSSKTAIEMLEKNVNANGYEADKHSSVCTDAIDYLKSIPQGKFDLMIVDPPAFAKHRGSLNNALRAYQRLNASAIEKIASGGIIFTFSCSQVVDRQAFALSVFSAAASVGRKVRILNRLSQSNDHPVNIYHPEGEYLKGLIIYVE